MGLRFRKSFSLGNGLRLTLSKSGPSLSFGKRGARVGVSKRGIHTSFSLLGTGISYVKEKRFKKP